MVSLRRIDAFALFLYLSFVGFVKFRMLENIGVAAEQYWIIRNRNLTVLEGLFYSDPSRTFMSFFFGILYRIYGEDFSPYLVFNQLLTVLVGVLVFLICRQKNVNILFSLLASTFAGIAMPDDSSYLFSMLVVKQCSIALLLIILLIDLSIEGRLAGIKLILISFLSFFCIFTYEASLTPLLVIFWFLFKKRDSEKFRDLHYAIIAPVVVFTFWSFFRYFILARDSYQSGKVRIPNTQELRESFSNYLSIMNPVVWDDHERDLFVNCLASVQEITGEFSSIATLAFTVTFVILSLYAARAKLSFFRETGKQETSDVLTFLFLTISSYIPYLVVTDGASSWRTHLIAQSFFGIFLGLLFQWLSRSPLHKYLSLLVFFMFVSSAVHQGVSTTNLQTLHMAKYWNDHQDFFSALTTEAPRIRADYFLLVTDVPAGNEYCESGSRDIFEDPYWFQAGINTYYSERWNPKSSRPSATYINESLTPQNFVQSSEGELSLNVFGVPHNIPLSRVLIFSMRGGAPKLLSSMEIELIAGFPIPNYAPELGLVASVNIDDVGSRANLLVGQVRTP